MRVRAGGLESEAAKQHKHERRWGCWRRASTSFGGQISPSFSFFSFLARDENEKESERGGEREREGAE